MSEEVPSTFPKTLCNVPQPIPASERATDNSEKSSTGSHERLRLCHFCKKLKPVHCWLDETSCACHGCYQTHVRKGICSECGKEKRISKITDDGDYLCHACYQKNRPEERCVCCGKLGKITERYPDGTGLRNTCYQRKRRAQKKKAAQLS